MFAGSMPNFRTSAVAVETATKCLATARSSPSARTHQARAVRAFVSVSIVVNVLDATTKSVSWGSEEHTAALQSRGQLVRRLLLVKKKSVPGSNLVMRRTRMQDNYN